MLLDLVNHQFDIDLYAKGYCEPKQELLNNKHEIKGQKHSKDSATLLNIQAV